MPKTAILIGATGLVGAALTDALLADSRFEKVVVFVRRATGKNHPKLEEHIVNFDAIDNWKQLLTGDVLFSAMGTTIGKAGSKEAQYKIDYTYQYEVAKAASENGVRQYVLVSSAGASPQSKIFYSRMKGELKTSCYCLRLSHLVPVICSTGSPSWRARGATSCRRWPRRASTPSRPTCAATATPTAPPRWRRTGCRSSWATSSA